MTTEPPEHLASRGRSVSPEPSVRPELSVATGQVAQAPASAAALTTAVRQLTVVREAGGALVGAAGLRGFVRVPTIGADVLEWLAAGADVAECAERAAATTGQPVEVAEFLTGLTAAGILPRLGEAGAVAVAPDAVAPVRFRRLGALLFGPVAWTLAWALVLLAAGLLISRPELRPRSSDVLVTATPLLNMLLLTLIGLVTAFLHESAHVVAAARIGIDGRMSLGRRLWLVVAQTDLTGLWAVPRRRRFGPLLAGMMVNAVLAAVAVLLVEVWGNALGPGGIAVARAVAFVQYGVLTMQGALFMRTDIYALLLVGAGVSNLWRLKSACWREWLRRTTFEDDAVLAAASPRSRRIARGYLALYVPGVTLAGGYFVAVSLPATIAMARMAWQAARDSTPAQPTWWLACLALVLIVVPSMVMAVRWVATGWRSLRVTVTRR